MFNDFLGAVIEGLFKFFLMVAFFIIGCIVMFFAIAGMILG